MDEWPGRGCGAAARVGRGPGSAGVADRGDPEPPALLAEPGVVHPERRAGQAVELACIQKQMHPVVDYPEFDPVVEAGPEVADLGLEDVAASDQQFAIPGDDSQLGPEPGRVGGAGSAPATGYS